MRATLLLFAVSVGGLFLDQNNSFAQPGRGGDDRSRQMNAFMDRIFKGRNSIKSSDLPQMLRPALERAGLRGDTISRTQMEAALNQLRQQAQSRSAPSSSGGSSSPAPRSSASSSTGTQETTKALSDPGSLRRYQSQVGKSFTFQVTGKTIGSLWGTNVYTTDSSLAKASVHAGVLKNGESGQVVVKIVRGLSSFRGSTKNGVTSRDWGSYPAAYTVRRAGPDPSLKVLDAKPEVYYGNVLPEGLPDWFAQVDANHDGQIALYEWRDAKRSTEEFTTYDQNNDCYVLAQEVQRVMGLSQKDPKSPSSSASSRVSSQQSQDPRSRFSGGGGFNRSGSSGGFSGGGFNRGGSSSRFPSRGFNRGSSGRGR